MRVSFVVTIVVLMCSCIKSTSQTKVSLIAESPISQYQNILNSLNDYESLSLLRQIEICKGKNDGILSYQTFNPYFDFYDTKKQTIINSSKLTKSLESAFGRNVANDIYGVHLYNDTLCVVANQTLGLFNFKDFQLLTQNKIQTNDGLYFSESNIYTNSTDKLLSIYSLNGKLIKQIEFPRETLAGYIFFANDNMFLYNDYTNEIVFCSLDSLHSLVTRKQKLQLEKNLHLMYVSDKYFVCGYKNRNSAPVKSNELVFISLDYPHEKMIVNLDSAVINDKIMDRTVVKGNIDGAPVPEFQPYWRVCGAKDTYYILIQSKQKVYLYSFNIK
jgi:hypothetical protein